MIGGFTNRLPKTSNIVKAGVSIANQTNGLENYVRVLDVVTDSSHKLYKKYGGSQALYGVVYQRLFENKTDNLEDVERDQFAYCLHSTVRRIPVKNEIVTIDTILAADMTEEISGAQEPKQKTYWIDIVSLWNSPNLNAYPDTIKYSGQEIDTGDNYIEQSSIKPLQLNTGDVCIEGRFGQSLRFGGTSSSSAANPFLILRNGQGSTNGDTANECPDKDGSSIYMTSDQTVDVTEAQTKRKAWKKEPGKFKDYKGNQIVAVSDRVVLNAREEDIQLNAKENVGVVAKVVGVDGEEYVAFDAKKVYLGTAALKEKEPVLLGQTSVDWLTKVLETLDKLLEVMKTTPPQPPVWVPAVVSAATLTKMSLLKYKAELNTLKSKKVYTE